MSLEFVLPMSLEFFVTYVLEWFTIPLLLTYESPISFHLANILYASQITIFDQPQGQLARKQAPYLKSYLS
jgi:hypothetical protein